MEKMEIKEIAAAVGCKMPSGGTVAAISTDSREIPEGCLFVALEGERFDGHDYVAQAFAKGAGWALIHHDCGLGGMPPERVLRVKNTQDAFIAIGGAYRSKFQINCVGITGSVGKTTTKEMIAEVLSCAFPTLKTEGNLNNEIGMPKTLLRLTPEHRAAVIEMGMQGPGEIAALAAAAKPGIGVITNIGTAHLEQLGTREAILRAKLELADALPDGAPLLLCGDNDLLRAVKMPRLHVHFYGIDNAECGMKAKDIREHADGSASFILLDGEAAFPVTLPCIGRHNVYNALAACAVGRELGIPLDSCAKALEGYIPSGMRQKVVPWRGMTVVEDCYNASPDSMQAALTTLSGFQGKRIAVLGDMLELGVLTQQAHYETGAFAAQQGIDLVLAYGVQAAQVQKGAQDNGTRALAFLEKDSLVEELKKELRPGCAVWVKGSHGMHMEQILEQLYAFAP